MRYGIDHKEQTRARVLSAAARSVLAEGPHRIGVADVMRKAGLTHGGFYAHFSGRDELVVAAIELLFDEAFANLQRLTRERAPADALAAYIDWYLSTGHRDAREAGCPLAALSADVPRLDPAARRRYTRGAGRLTSALAMLLSAIGRRDADALAKSAFAEMIGALVLARGADSADSDAILESSRTALRVRLGLDGTPATASRPRRPTKK